MNSGKIIVTIAVFLIVVLGGVFLIQSQNKNSISGTKTTQGDSEEIAPRYFKYSEDNLAKAKAGGRPILYFWAVWCPTCQALDAELRQRSKELPDDVTILQVNYDTEKELKQKYQITQQHTLVQIDNQGNEVTKWIGGGFDTLVEQIN